MKHLTAQQMLSFNDQLRKEASIWHTLGRVGGRAAASIAGRPGQYGARLLIGGGVGALGGAAVDEDNRLRGAVLGGALGAGLTGGSILAQKEGREALKNVGKHQLYSVTGKGVKDLDEARKIGVVRARPDAEKFQPGLADKMLGRSKEQAFEKAHRKALLEEEAFDKGLLHLPGIAKSPVQALKSGWQRSGVVGKGLAGLGAYETGKGFLKKPEEGGPGRLEAGLSGLGSTAGMLVAPPAILGGTLAMEGLRRGGGLIGRGGDALAGKLRPRPPAPEQYPVAQ